MAPNSSSRPAGRSICPQCLRPPRACLCHCAQPVAQPVQVLVLQHPQEVGHAKNTARLLHLCLPGSQLEVAETLSPQAAQTWLHTPWPGQCPSTVVRTVLLYPPTVSDPQLPVSPAPELPAAWLTQPEALRLIVIDGTWRKSRKMLYLNPALQALPRLSLHNIPQGRYAIRKAHLPGQLSSFEAAVQALAQLNHWSDTHPNWVQLMQSFEQAIQWHQQLQHAGNQCV